MTTLAIAGRVTCDGFYAGRICAVLLGGRQGSRFSTKIGDNHAYRVTGGRVRWKGWRWIEIEGGRVEVICRRCSHHTLLDLTSGV